MTSRFTSPPSTEIHNSLPGHESFQLDFRKRQVTDASCNSFLHAGWIPNVIVSYLCCWLNWLWINAEIDEDQGELSLKSGNVSSRCDIWYLYVIGERNLPSVRRLKTEEMHSKLNSHTVAIWSTRSCESHDSRLMTQRRIDSWKMCPQSPLRLCESFVDLTVFSNGTFFAVKMKKMKNRRESHRSVAIFLTQLKFRIKTGSVVNVSRPVTSDGCCNSGM